MNATFRAAELLLVEDDTADTRLIRACLEQAGYRIVRKEGVFLKPLMTSQLQPLGLSNEIIEGMCTVGIDYPELCCAVMFEAQVEPT